MKRTSLIVLALILLTSTVALAQSVDTFTSASVSNFYEPAATIEEISEHITFNGVVVVSTTNPDGSPNAAVIIPSIFENQYVIMQMAPNQTLENLAQDGRVVISVFLPFPDAEKNTGELGDIRKYGARLICEVLSEGTERTEAIARYNAINESRQLPADHNLLKIVRILPIG